MLLFRAARPETMRIDWLDDFTLVYHCPSGLTHLLTVPAPEILATLGEAGMTLRDLATRLADDFDLGGEVEDGGDEALAARLDELVAVGLIAVERAGGT